MSSEDTMKEKNMGMHTSIRGVVRVKSEYIKLADHIATYNDEELEKDKFKYPFVREYFKTERADFIPSDAELQSQFQDEDKFFSPRVKKDVFFFKSDLKNYEDEKTGESPIESFLNNILVNISDEFFLLETANDYQESVSQYNFSTEVLNAIEIINITNTEKESFYGFYPPTEDIDVFKEYKEANNLEVFR